VELKSDYIRTGDCDVPKEWTSATLLALADGRKDLFDDGDWIESEHLVENGVRLVQTGNIGVGEFLDRQARKYISPQSFVKLRCKALCPGDILICRLADPAGRACIFPELDAIRSITAVDVTIFRPSHDVADRRYLVAVLSTSRWFRAVSDRCGGSTRTRISRSQLGRIAIPLPSLPEQRAIAEALSDADALLDGLDRLIAKKRDLKQAAMQQLLTGKTRLPGFSGEWKPLVFGDLASPGMDRVNPKLTGGHAFCVELEHIEQKTGRLLGWSETAPQSSLKAVFAADDVLFGKLRAYLRKYWHASMPGVCSTEIWVLKAKSAIAPGYLYQLVQTDWFIDAASTAYGTHMPRSDWKVVRDLELRVPRKDEQAKIAEVLGDMDAEIDALKRRRDKAYDLKHAMMQELLTGKTRLVAPEADHA
jgi:type I restriction enzyme S subunit